ncbi:hypothetical protein B0H11DRAFT_1924585 [Mycena galericulata]|nr:hypothetical protein B0H11DRAFT_1924585 [Mycena galericulata]
MKVNRVHIRRALLPLILVVPLRGVETRIRARVPLEVQRECVFEGLGEGTEDMRGEGVSGSGSSFCGSSASWVSCEYAERERQGGDDLPAVLVLMPVLGVLLDVVRRCGREERGALEVRAGEGRGEGARAGGRVRREREMSVTLGRSLGGGFVYPIPEPGPDANPPPCVDAEVESGARKPDVGGGPERGAERREEEGVVPARLDREPKEREEHERGDWAAQRVKSTAVTRRLSERQVNTGICSTRENMKYVLEQERQEPMR